VHFTSSSYHNLSAWRTFLAYEGAEKYEYFSARTCKARNFVGIMTEEQILAFEKKK
jgi:hypothetical protein